jgi:hypothetical protein
LAVVSPEQRSPCWPTVSARSKQVVKNYNPVLCAPSKSDNR